MSMARICWLRWWLRHPVTNPGIQVVELRFASLTLQVFNESDASCGTGSPPSYQDSGFEIDRASFQLRGSGCTDDDVRDPRSALRVEDQGLGQEAKGMGN